MERLTQLEYQLQGVMHFVDKWFDKAPKIDEVQRAAQARAIALEAIERVEKELAAYKNTGLTPEHCAELQKQSKRGDWFIYSQPRRLWFGAIKNTIASCVQIAKKT